MCSGSGGCSGQSRSRLTRTTWAGRFSTFFGPDCRKFRQAHLLAGNGVALELFELVERPAEPPDGFTYWRVGIFHLCLLASDIEALAAVISGSGGRVRTSTIWQIFRRRAVPHPLLRGSLREHHRALHAPPRGGVRAEGELLSASVCRSPRAGWRSVLEGPPRAQPSSRSDAGTRGAHDFIVPFIAPPGNVAAASFGRWSS